MATKYEEVYEKSDPETHGLVVDTRIITVHGKTSLQCYVEWLNRSTFDDGWFYISNLGRINS